MVNQYKHWCFPHVLRLCTALVCAMQAFARATGPVQWVLSSWCLKLSASNLNLRADFWITGWRLIPFMSQTLPWDKPTIWDLLKGTNSLSSSYSVLGPYCFTGHAQWYRWTLIWHPRGTHCNDGKLFCYVAIWVTWVIARECALIRVQECVCVCVCVCV